MVEEGETQSNVFVSVAMAMAKSIACECCYYHTHVVVVDKGMPSVKA
jgi:hypothetical protein